MTELIKKSGLRWLWITAIFIVLDQLTKYWTIQSLALYESYEILPFFNFTYARNYGAAFSFLGDAGGWQRYLFTVIALLISAFLMYSLKKNNVSKRWENIAFSLVLSGAIGNVIDRIIYGYVIDFLDLDLGFYRWPTFNVADSAIFVGAAMIILSGFIYPETNNDTKENKE